MRKLTIAALAATTLALPVKDAFAVSEAAVLWLLISPGSRPAGMGEAFVALADDASATWWNPAGLGFSRGKDFRFMHSDWLPAFKLDDIFFDFLAGSVHLPNLGGTLGASIIYMNEGDQTHTDENGNVLGVITSREYALGLSYGQQLNPDLAVGFGAKLIVSDLADGQVGNQDIGTGISFGLDVGTLWKTWVPFTQIPMNLGAAISNIGPEISYVDEKQADPLPTNLKLGTALNLYSDTHNEVNFVFDLNKQLVRKSQTGRVRATLRDQDGVEQPAFLDPEGRLTTDPARPDGTPHQEAFWGIYEADPVYKAMFTSWFPNGVQDELRNYVYNVGAEYWYRSEAGGIGQAAFGIRAGYLNDIAGSIKSYTTGLSILVNVFSFDFSYEISVDADNPSPRDKTMRYSLGVKF
jgi:hypothetical protein